MTAENDTESRSAFSTVPKGMAMAKSDSKERTMNLRDFIRHNIEGILQEWENHAFMIQPDNGSMSKEELRDHAEKILFDIADGIDRSRDTQFRDEQSRGIHPLLENAPRSAVEHGITRHDFGFSLHELLIAYSALRVSVMRLWAESESEESSRDEIVLFNEEVDGVIKEAVEAFATVADKQRRLLEKVITATRDHCYLLNGDGKFIYANTSLLDDLNINNSVLMGMTHLDLHLPGSAMLYQEAMKVIATGEERRGEITYSLPSGGERHYEYVYEPILGDQKRVEGVAALERDITERKQAEEELKAANKELEAFSYSVSHDLHAPLRTISGFISLLSKHAGQLDGKANEYLQRIEAGAAKMDHLIDDLLSLSRISRLEMVIQEIALSAMARVVVRDLELQHPERHVEKNIANDLRARGDLRLIKIALTNLFGNAWKYTDKTAEARVEFGSCRRDGKEVFFVRDNGAGFSMDQAYRLFQPFQRLHSESEFTGMGIGLPIVHRVISRHGGEIWGEGEVGKGATFYFTLGS